MARLKAHMKNKSARRKESSLKAARAPKALNVNQLRWQCDPATLKIKTTDDVHPTHEIIGQQRALRALRVGLEMDHFGYNIFVTGLPGTGRTTTIKRLLKEFEHRKGELKDHCYVYNFKDKDNPHALSLPPGKGLTFQNDMDEMISVLRQEIPKIFDSKEYEKNGVHH